MHKPPVAAYLAMLAAFSLPAAAGEGRIPIGFPNITLAAPGHYVVTANLDGGGTPAVIITADGVTLDLNGFTLSDAVNDVISIQGSAGAQLGVTIRNGRISNGFAGIYADGTSGRRLRLEDLVIEGSSENGVLIAHADELTVRNCTIRGTTNNGLQAVGVGDSFSGRISNNEISGTQLTGIELYGLSAGIIEGNRLTDTGLAGGATHGILLDADPLWNAGGNLLVRNMVVDHRGTGAALRVAANVDSNLVRGNVVRGTTVADGLQVDGDSTLVIGNTLTGNTGTGLLLAGATSLADLNQLSGNGNYGLRCAGPQEHAYRNNMLRGSAPSGIDAASCSTSIDAGGNIP